MIRLHRTILGAAAVLITGGAVLADSLVVKNIPYENVTIIGVKNDQLLFRTGRGNETARALSDVTQMTITGEDAFNNGERAFADGEWAKATTEYSKAQRTTQKQWLKDWLVLRLIESAIKADRFDEAIKGYVELADKNPGAAAGITLTPPPAGSTFLPEAIKNVEAASNRTKSLDSKELLLKLLIELQRAKGDAKGEQDATDRMVQLQVERDPNSPEAQKALMLQKLQKLRGELAAKKYDEVIRLIEKDAADILEPSHQADALFLYAEAQAGKAASGKGPDWKDVAVSYIRVVANAPANSPHVPEALMKAAEIHHKHLNEPQAARKLYQQIETEFKGQEVAGRAKKAMAEIK